MSNTRSFYIIQFDMLGERSFLHRKERVSNVFEQFSTKISNKNFNIQNGSFLMDGPSFHGERTKSVIYLGILQ